MNEEVLVEVKSDTSLSSDKKAVIRAVDDISFQIYKGKCSDWWENRIRKINGGKMSYEYLSAF